MSYSEAALCYNIPKTTIFCRLKGINGAAGVGRAICQVTERLIVELVPFMSDIGFSLKRNDILTVVENYLKESKQTHLFKTGKPTRKWYNSFIKKNAKNICERKATSMQAVREVSSQPAIIDEWFSQVDAVYREHNLNEKLFHVFNCDESGLKFDQGKVNIVCRKGIKNQKQLAPTNEKHMATILTCCDAFGNFLSHQVVYKGRNLMKAWVQGGASDVYYSTSKSGWVESENFIEWFRSIFLVHANNLQGSKILF